MSYHPLVYTSLVNDREDESPSCAKLILISYSAKLILISYSAGGLLVGAIHVYRPHCQTRLHTCVIMVQEAAQS